MLDVIAENAEHDGVIKEVQFLENIITWDLKPEETIREYIIRSNTAVYLSILIK